MRIKQPVLILTILLFSAFAIVAALAFLSKNIHNKKNGFNRLQLGFHLQPQHQFTFPTTVNKIIGASKGRLYFQGNNPYELYTTDQQLNSLKIISMDIQPDMKLQSGIRMFLHDRHIYLSCRNMPGFIDYALDSGNAVQHSLTWYYSKEANLSGDQFIIRANDRQTKDPVFVKLNLKNTSTRMEDHFSEKKGESNFPTDGILYYDSTTHLACYTYFYQNGFICMDTNLNLTVKARTIDTLTKKELNITRVGSSITMKQPPHFVNYTGSVYAGKLFLQSMLKADNELPLDFSGNTVIDVYDLINGKYKGSFYLPDLQGRKPHQFQVIDKKLYAVYGKTVVLYDVNFIEDL
jgi:hypothetical protein